METKTETLGDVLSASEDRISMGIHTSLPGQVVTFDQSKNTVSVMPMINQVLKNGEAAELPVLVDVPVQFPRGGDFVLTFPISPGDEGLLVFNERCIDGWWATGGKSIPLDYRMHDYSDAIFIAGISSLPKVITNVFMGGVSMRTLDDSTYIRLTKGTIFIKGNIVHEGNTEQTGNYTRDGNSTTTGLITGNGGMAVNGGSGVAITGPISHTGGSITSNGKNIGSDHTHSGVEPGGGNTGGPN